MLGKCETQDGEYFGQISPVGLWSDCKSCSRRKEAVEYSERLIGTKTEFVGYSFTNYATRVLIASHLGVSVCRLMSQNAFRQHAEKTLNS